MQMLTAYPFEAIFTSLCVIATIRNSIDYGDHGGFKGLLYRAVTNHYIGGTYTVIVSTERRPKIDWKGAGVGFSVGSAPCNSNLLSSPSIPSSIHTCMRTPAREGARKLDLCSDAHIHILVNYFSATVVSDKKTWKCATGLCH
jgi:hypothetical protein